MCRHNYLSSYHYLRIVRSIHFCLWAAMLTKIVVLYLADAFDFPGSLGSLWRLSMDGISLSIYIQVGTSLMICLFFLVMYWSMISYTKLPSSSMVNFHWKLIISVKCWYSNARHGRGAIIPHLNFSIPCAALEPIHRFSKGEAAEIIVLWLGPTFVIYHLRTYFST